jgi:adenylate kinase
MVLELQVETQELVRRMLARKRPDDTSETISERLIVYKNQTAPVLQYYAERDLLTAIDGSGTPDDVFARIQASVTR